MSHLSPRTMQVYRHIKAHIERHGFAPSVRQISAALDIASTSQVVGCINQLVAAGKLTKQRGGARALALVKPTAAAPTPTLEEQAQEWTLPGQVLRWQQGADGGYVHFKVIAAGCGVVTTVEA